MSLVKTQTLSQIVVDRVCDILSEREGVRYKFFRFLNLSKFSVVFISDNGEQRVLCADHIQRMIDGKDLFI